MKISLYNFEKCEAKLKAAILPQRKCFAGTPVLPGQKKVLLNFLSTVVPKNCSLLDVGCAVTGGCMTPCRYAVFFGLRLTLT